MPLFFREKFDDKRSSLCYNQFKALYFCKYDTTAYFLPVRITLKRADHFAFFDKDMEIFNALCYQLIAGKLKCQMWKHCKKSGVWGFCRLIVGAYFTPSCEKRNYFIYRKIKGIVYSYCNSKCK